MNVLIIEDEAPAFRRLQKCLEEIDPELKIIDVIDSVGDSIKWLKNHQHPDLIFMDIQLSDGISFDIFDQTEILTPVIFTTAFDEYMLRAFKVNSIDYLLKPIKKEDLQQSLDKYKRLNSHGTDTMKNLNQLLRNIKLDDRKYRSRFLVKKGDELFSISTDQIVCFHTHLGVVHLKTSDGRSFLMDQSLDEIMELVAPDQFYRANRQYIVHFNGIRKVHKFHKGKLLIELTQNTGEQVTVSAEKAGEFKTWLNE